MSRNREQVRFWNKTDTKKLPNRFSALHKMEEQIIVLLFEHFNQKDERRNRKIEGKF